MTYGGKASYASSPPCIHVCECVYTYMGVLRTHIILSINFSFNRVPTSMNICTCIYIHIYTRLRRREYICMCVSACVCAHERVCVCLCTDVSVRISGCMSYSLPHSRIHIYSFIHSLTLFIHNLIVLSTFFWSPSLHSSHPLLHNSFLLPFDTAFPDTTMGIVQVSWTTFMLCLGVAGNAHENSHSYCTQYTYVCI